MSMNDKNNTNIDESLYSRQLYVLGHEAMQNMSKSRILISGLGGLGVEIAKNIILSGVKSVTLHDLNDVKIEDLSSQFYLTAKDLGINRAVAASNKLAELNMYVNVETTTFNPINQATVDNFDLVIVNNYKTQEQIRINNLCRNSNVKFISARTAGLFGQIFCDFGDEFIINDTDGEQPLTSIVINIDNDGIVMVSDTTPHGLTNSDQIELVEVKGMDINNKLFKIKVISPTSFQLLDFDCQENYKSGGIVKQVKLPETVSFKSMKESIDSPEFVMTDFENIDRPSESHLAFQALDEFQQTHGYLPEAWNTDDASKFYEIVYQMDSSMKPDTFNKFSFVCQGDLAPMQSVIGSITAQEAIKACSHKFRPINQWLYFDSLDCLPNDNLTPEDCETSTTRYDPQIKVFGNNFQNKLANQKWFVVGSGAIGCELLKNFAMIGLATGSEGKITITDMDTIEKSNLNRQFLFRSKDIGKAKSESAAESILAMNPTINIEAQLNKVCPENEEFYNTSFYQNLDGIANALDNVQARLYVDRQCVLHGKPLLESGTLGTKGNTQVVIPGLTESYGSTQDPPEKSIQICTIKNFPNSIEHTIQWARDEFEGLFTKAPQNVELFE